MGRTASTACAGVRSGERQRIVSPTCEPGPRPRHRWYRFRLRAESSPNRTLVRARVWGENSQEPLFWQLTLVDTSAARLTHGTVGLWSHGEGHRRFKDLQVAEVERDQVLLAEPFCGPGPDPEGWLDFALEREGISVAALGVPPQAFKVLLAHSPDMARPAADLGIDLVLAGHTHGGQVRLPLVGALYSQTFLGRRYAAGLFSFGTTKLYVNRGIGNAFVPFRFLCPPEVTVIHLLSAQRTAGLKWERTRVLAEGSHGILTGH